MDGGIDEGKVGTADSDPEDGPTGRGAVGFSEDDGDEVVGAGAALSAGTVEIEDVSCGGGGSGVEVGLSLEGGDEDGGAGGGSGG